MSCACRCAGENVEVVRIQFVIAPYDFGGHELEAVEPVIDGVSLVDIVKRADGEIAFAGLTPPETYIDAWQRAVDPEDAESAVVLGCGCGYAECSNVTAVCEVRGGVVVWSDFRASIRPFGEPGPRGSAGLGPFEFAAEDYRRALSAPVRRTSPVRETHDIERLAAGFPRDPGGWLREMTMAFGRDFLTPYEPEQTREALGVLRRPGCWSLPRIAGAGAQSGARDHERSNRTSPAAAAVAA